MKALSSRGSRFALALALALGTAVAAPMACFFPGYTYDGSGGTGGSTTHTTTTTSTTTSTTTTGTTGGAGTTSTTTTTSGTGGGSTTTTTTTTSSTGGPPCASKDCTDPACADSYACVPAVPNGWMGPFELFEGAKAPAGCGIDYPSQEYVGNNSLKLPVPPAVCNCTCNPATGETCEVTGQADPNVPGTIDAILVTDALCGAQFHCATGLEVPPTWNFACYGADGAQANQDTCGANANAMCDATAPAGNGPCNQSVRMTPLQVTGGSCTPNSQPPTLPGVSWNTEALACGDAAAPGTGCTGGAACLPIPGGGFLSGMCIMATGMVACPAGQFQDQHLYYGTVTEGRTCTSCGCGTPAGGDCTATVTISSDGFQNSCTAVGATLNATSAGTACVNVTNTTNLGSREAKNVTITTAGTCQGTAEPMGTVTPASPTTFCCVP
jgi:hypothetical protein